MIVGYPVGCEQKKQKDNNKKGVIPLPSYDTDPINQKRRLNRKMNFGAMYSRGESPREDGLFNIRTANGISRSNGPGRNEQYNWGDNNADGEWNNNCGWPGGNRTGE